MKLKRTRRTRTTAELWKSEVIARLKEPRCWVCAHLLREVNRDFFWFVNEQYYEIGVIDKMRLAYGFCPTHTRYFLETDARSANVTVFSYVTWYVVTRLNAARDLLVLKSGKEEPRLLCRQAFELLRPQNACPMCSGLDQTERIEISMLASALAIDEVKAAYEESAGLCIPHFRQAGFRSDWDLLVFLCGDLRRRLSAKTIPARGSTALLEQAIGLDQEHALRLRDDSKSKDSPSDKSGPHLQTYIEPTPLNPFWSPTFHEILKSLAEPGCPVCRACAQGVHGYFDWLGSQMDAQPSLSSNWDPSWQVCSNHLWELYAAGHQSGAMLIGRHTIHQWLERLDRLAARLKKKPAEGSLERLRQAFLIWCGARAYDSDEESDGRRSRWSKVTAVLESPQTRMDDLREVAFRADLCQACAHVQTITHRTLDLILRALEDPNGRKAYHAASGLCLRHCVEAAKLAEVPAALLEILSAQIARLRVLEWELQEASRKDNWSVRYEPKGPEKDIWRRAAYQFCGV